MSSSCWNQSAHLSLNLKFYHLNYKSGLFHFAFTNISMCTVLLPMCSILLSMFTLDVFQNESKSSTAYIVYIY